MLEKNIISSKETKKLLDAYVEHRQLFMFKDKNLIIVFRLLTLLELEAISKLSGICDIYAIEDWIFDKSVIWSSINPDLILAGTYSNISKKIINKSNINDEVQYKKLLEESRSKSGSLEFVATTTIMKAFPTIIPSSLNLIEQTKMLAMAEAMLQNQITIGEEAKEPPKRKGYNSIGGNYDARLEAKKILSKENADVPNIQADNAALRNL